MLNQVPRPYYSTHRVTIGLSKQICQRGLISKAARLTRDLYGLRCVGYGSFCDLPRSLRLLAKVEFASGYLGVGHPGQQLTQAFPEQDYRYNYDGWPRQL